MSALKAESDTSFLEPTRYIDKSCCCCHCAYFPYSKLRICGEWICKPLNPCIIITIHLISIAVFYFDTKSVFPSRTIEYISYITQLFCFFCLTWSYFSTIIRGPGYIPFSWSMSKKKEYKWNEICSTFAEFREQAIFAREHDRPPHSHFSEKARRIVLRADHYCFWVQSFIGARNYRDFALVSLWSSLYSVAFMASHYFWFRQFKFDWFKIVGLLFNAFHAFMSVFSAYYFAHSMKNLARDQTTLEMWSKEATDSQRGCCRNCEDMCGSRYLCFLWPFPFIWCIRPLEDGFYDNPAFSKQLQSSPMLNQSTESLMNQRLLQGTSAPIL